MINQMANYAFIDWKDNMDILDDAPSVYYPIVCTGRSDEEILQMEKENALPHGWENMKYTGRGITVGKCNTRGAFSASG